MFSFEEAGNHLHLERFSNTISSYPLEPRLLPLLLSHPLALALDISDASISLIAMVQNFLFITSGEWFCLGRGRENDEFLSCLGGPLSLRSTRDRVYSAC